MEMEIDYSIPVLDTLILPNGNATIPIPVFNTKISIQIIK